MTIVGAILAAIGFLLSAVTPHLELLYVTFGLISGFGLSLCYVAAVVIVAYYFDQKRSFATGISVCGSGVGTFLFAPLTQYLVDQYNGWRGATVILAGIYFTKNAFILEMCTFNSAGSRSLSPFFRRHFSKHGDMWGTFPWLRMDKNFPKEKQAQN